MNFEFDPIEHSHRRFNPLLNEWVLISPHRAKRPWQGQVENVAEAEQHSYEPECYLCPGNTRINGEINENYTGPYVFNNDHSALQKDTPVQLDDHPLFKSQSERGECSVLCYTPDHSKTLATLPIKNIIKVIEVWKEQSEELSETYQWIQIFENKGAMMGCSNPHPHGQIWAQNHIPTIVNKKQTTQLDYLITHNTNLLHDYVDLEISTRKRIVLENDDWVVVVPFWASWPFEVMLLPRFRVQQLTELSDNRIASLAMVLKQITTRYDNLFNSPFPYSMGWHGAPYDDADHPEWTLHASFYPPLLRSSTVRKFMVGYEMFAETQRDITPEQAAQMLRDTSDIHYCEVNNV